MRVAVLSDVHVLGPGEERKERRVAAELGADRSAVSRGWRRALHRLRRRFWNWHPAPREACFLRALDEIAARHPDLVVANGDYGGDVGGIGLSDPATFASVAHVVEMIRATFPGRARFVFGDHEIGKYSTALQRGGIRLESLRRGEKEIGIASHWVERQGDFLLVGVHSTLLALDLFLPEALPSEVDGWVRRRDEHLAEVEHTFEGLPRGGRVILFCHDPSALSVLHERPAVRARLDRVACTVLGHLHTPKLLPLTRAAGRLTGWSPRYPVARIIARGAQGAGAWKAFRPVVCPSTFGTGHHFAGGVLLLETGRGGEFFVRRHRVRC